jgi:gamma-glutamyltranspeptidase / glutathione hydrolase
VRRFSYLALFFSFTTVHVLATGTPVTVVPVTAPHGMVVAGHPEAAAIGRDVLAAGGNAMDAAVAVSLALGVAEPYGSGLGGKLMLIYHDATTGTTHAVDGMDAASLSLDPALYRRLPNEARRTGWTSVAVPGLPAALHAAHVRWGARPWADNITPVLTLAEHGFTVLAKTRDLFIERIEKLRADADLAALYLRDGEVPPVGTRLPNPALARTLGIYAAQGADGFYRGPIAAEIIAAAQRAGVNLTAQDFAGYTAMFSAPLKIDYHGYALLSAPPPTTGAALTFTLLKVLETEALSSPLHTAENIDRIGRAWRVVYPDVQRDIADTTAARGIAEEMLSATGISRYRERMPAQAIAGESGANDATTHFVIVDHHGNVVSATQSLSLHFGAGVVAAGIILNDSLSNFAYDDPGAANAAAPGKRPRSTITPLIALRDDRPVLALGLPGAGRIPTAMLQVLIEHLSFNRPLEQAMGDTRLHWQRPFGRDAEESIEAETSLAPEVVNDLRERGWKVDLMEEPGTGLHFGGVNAIRLEADGTRTGYADPRRTNAAAGH